MSGISLSASYASQSTSMTSVTVAAPDQGIPKPDPVKETMKQAKESLKVLKKLDKIVDLLRSDKPHTALAVYNRLGRMEKEAEKAEPPQSLSFEAADLSRTSITIGEDGIEISRQQLSYASLEAGDASLKTLSMSASRMYLSLDSSAPASTDAAA